MCTCVKPTHCMVLVSLPGVLCDLTLSCLCLVRFDYCRFIELDYVPMETGYMVSMRPTKGFAASKSPTKGYTSTKSPDRHSRTTNSPSTPNSRSVLGSSSVLIAVDPLKHGNVETICTVINVSWCLIYHLHPVTSFLRCHANCGKLKHCCNGVS